MTRNSGLHPPGDLASTQVALLTLPLGSISESILSGKPHQVRKFTPGPWTRRSRASWPSFKLRLAVPPTDRNPDGIRYRLALLDIETNRILALFDNHHPKGHHRHWEDGRETPYNFRSAGKLIEDYLEAIQQEEKRRESKKD